jgi:TetR/AcrR family transcriptional repressor of mexJK operon
MMDAKTQELLQKASEVFLEHGFTGTTTDMIQKACGFSKATIYARFSTKESLFKAVIEHKCSEFTQRIQCASIHETCIENALNDIGHAHLDQMLTPETMGLYRVVIADAPRFPDIAHHFFQSGPMIVRQVVTRIMENAAHRGEIDIVKIGAERAAQVFLSLIRSEAQMECLTHPDMRPSEIQKDQWISIAIETFLRAYKTPSAH